jgi:hypothetical protein
MDVLQDEYSHVVGNILVVHDCSCTAANRKSVEALCAGSDAVTTGIRPFFVKTFPAAMRELPKNSIKNPVGVGETYRVRREIVSLYILASDIFYGSDGG